MTLCLRSFSCRNKLAEIDALYHQGKIEVGGQVPEGQAVVRSDVHKNEWCQWGWCSSINPSHIKLNPLLN